MLSPDIIVLLFSELQLARDVLAFRLVCKKWNEVSKRKYVKELRLQKQRGTCALRHGGRYMVCNNIGEYKCGVCNDRFLCSACRHIVCFDCDRRICPYCAIADAPACLECVKGCTRCDQTAQSFKDQITCSPSLNLIQCYTCDTFCCFECRVPCVMEHHEYRYIRDNRCNWVIKFVNYPR